MPLSLFPEEAALQLRSGEFAHKWMHLLGKTELHYYMLHWTTVDSHVQIT